VNPDSRSPRPLLVIFHGAFFFVPYVLFVLSIGRRDVEETFTLHFGPDFIPMQLTVLTCCFVGYIALWNMRRIAFPILFVSGAALLFFAFGLQSVSFFYYLPLSACLTSLPLWPLMK
jgi:hypothetical protein